jgi:hypothetical protein
MDWIQARIQCSLEGAWVTLRETVYSDIERWRELTKSPTDLPVISKEDRRVTITLNEHWATMERRENYIRARLSVAGAESPMELKLVPRLNAAGECRLWLGDQELEFWQASRRILEPLLFG